MVRIHQRPTYSIKEMLFMQFKIENSTLRLSNNCIFINNNKNDLSEKIYLALGLFLNSKNQVISKETLMVELWQSTIVSDDSLFKIIQEIRKLFKNNDMGSKVLVNVYGKGYKISPEIIISKTVVESKNKTSPLENSKNLQPKKRFIFALIFISLVVIGYFSIQGFNSNTIGDNEYITLRKLIKKSPEKVKNIIDKQYNLEELSASDLAKISFLKAHLLIKTGDFEQSTQLLKNTIELDNDSHNSQVVADAYSLLAWINTYTNKPELMRHYIDEATLRYRNIGDKKRLLYMEILLGRYYWVLNEAEKSINQFLITAESAKRQKDDNALKRSYMNLAGIYESIDELEKASLYINKALEISLAEPDPIAISYGFGQLSTIHNKLGNYDKTMKYAEQSIRYAIDANDTNLFQQSFSSLYNVLNKFGHKKLAEKYLKVAIQFQQNKNNKGHLTEAEINLAIIYLQTKRYKMAYTTFKKILAYELNNEEKQQAIAWLALTRYFQKDNIDAYSLAKEVYDSPKLENSTKIIAGLSLILSSQELERTENMHKIYSEIQSLLLDENPIEKLFFYEIAIQLFDNSQSTQLKQLTQQKQQFDNQLMVLKQNTQPDESFIKKLNEYLETKFVPK